MNCFPFKSYASLSTLPPMFFSNSGPQCHPDRHYDDCLSSFSLSSDKFIWQRQAYPVGKSRAGNLLLSFAILCAGLLVNKVLLVFWHMGMLIYSEPTYYYYQQRLHIPAIVSFWGS